MKRWLFPILLVSLFVTFGCAKLVFERGNGYTQAQIYRMRTTGSSQTNISNNTFLDYSPSVCPGTKKIVFVSSREGYRSSRDIYIMSVNGGDVQQLTSGMGDARNPKCSSRGLIAFASPVHGFERIWTVKTDGTGLHQVTNPGPNQKDVECDFYDDGRRIVFARVEGSSGRSDLYSVYFDGSQPINGITNTDNISENYPVVSHDGRLLGYTAYYPDSENVTIRIANVGSWTLVNEIVMQPPAKKIIRGLDFSCDDKRLFVAIESSDVPGTFQPNKFEIFSIKVDGTDQKRLTQNDVGDYFPSSICDP
jgi:Tol biopolymer transport system component